MMNFELAQELLNAKRQVAAEIIQRVYDHLFALNDETVRAQYNWNGIMTLQEWAMKLAEEYGVKKELKIL